MWSLGFIVGMVVTAIIVLTSVFAIIHFRRKAREARDRWDRGDFVFYSRIAIGVLVVTVGVAAVATFPWTKPYHYWETQSGVVRQIEARLLADGDGMSEKYAVRFEGDNQEFGCKDTRCALVSPGDMLTLRCIKVWVYSGTDGYDCSFVSNESPEVRERKARG